jgi:putative tryptophan/tyrosine transport system substrate-binding protein
MDWSPRGVVVRRREFIVGLGGLASIWLHPTGAQQPARRIGAIVLGGPDQQDYLRALREGLEALGWTDGKNIQVEYRLDPTQLVWWLSIPR